MASPLTLWSRRRLLTAAAVVPVLALPGEVLAGAREDAASGVVRGLVEQILAVLQQGALDGEQARALMRAIEQRTDLTLLARLAMGRHWRTATPEQQASYVELFRRYVLQSFVRRLSQVATVEIGSPAERFSILASRPVDAQDVLVTSKVVPPSGPPLKVDWRLREQPGGPVIIDLLVEGVSLLINQRAEFGAVLERSGVDGLLQLLEARSASA